VKELTSQSVSIVPEAPPLQGVEGYVANYPLTDEARRPSWLLESNPNVNESARLYTNPFDLHTPVGGGGMPLYKSLGGRLLSQSVARGLVGAAFFTAGCYALKVWKPGEKIADQHVLGMLPEALSKGFDWALTQPLQGTISLFKGADAAEEIMRFNKFMAKPHMVEKAMEESAHLLQKDVFGMTYGQEMVNRTFQFASGSIGAAVGRNIVAALDSNYKKSWLKEDGIDWKDLAVSTGKQTWKIMAYDQMEDWFAAPFYVWQLRAMRGGMDAGLMGNNAAKNSAMWSVQNDGNGAAERLSVKDGAATQEGSFQGVGAVDFQSRFMLYNFYTLLYRDLYNHASHLIGEVQKNGMEAVMKLPEKPVQSLSHGAAETSKYLMKSLIKSQIYMAPAVFAFWPQRVSMSRQHHTMVDGQSAQLITTHPTHAFDVNNPQQPFMQDGKPLPHVVIAARPSDIKAGNALFSGDAQFEMHQPNYDPYDPSNKGVLDIALSRLGKLGHGYARVMDNHIAQPAAEALSRTMGLDAVKASQEATWLADNFAATQLAYTPYMAMKYEVAQHYDTPQMDAAAYRFTDGLFGLNAKEAWAGLKDIANVVTFRPLSAETQKHVGERRGVVNSRYESECSSDKKQVELRAVAAIDKEVKELKKQGVAIPTATVEAMKHEGAARAVVMQQREQAASMARPASTSNRSHAERLLQDMPSSLDNADSLIRR
jgi:hypothetical protein